jgi:hypothetical protein
MPSDHPQQQEPQLQQQQATGHSAPASRPVLLLRLLHQVHQEGLQQQEHLFLTGHQEVSLGLSSSLHHHRQELLPPCTIPLLSLVAISVA